MSEIATLVETIKQLQTEVEKLQAGPPEVRRPTQERRVAEKREAVWVNLGSPNGYAHPSGRARVLWNGGRWIAYVDGKKLRKTYRSSYAARVAAGLKLSSLNKK
jgi:hypothetical protein